jgi:hypothetical protein
VAGHDRVPDVGGIDVASEQFQVGAADTDMYRLDRDLAGASCRPMVPGRSMTSTL